MSKIVRPSAAEIRALEKQKAQVHAKKREIIEGLPHLYGHKWYSWQRQFFETRNRIALLTAANQVGKSTVQIWKFIHWATQPRLWPELWPTIKPKLFYYLYPTQDIVNAEFRLKWVDWMPKGRFKDDPQCGWKLVASKNEREIHGIDFHSGIELHFKTYSQNVHDLQGGTVSYIGCDEELPEELWSELDQRLSATRGYFSSVFTATRNQQMWMRAMESKGEDELFKDAFKIQVSKYDCMTFDDGTPGLYTEEEIKAQIARCRNKAEIDRRIFGKFAADEGRTYPEFDPSRHYIPQKEIPRDWKIYSAVDVGSGGANSHPAAIIFIAVRPDNRLGHVFKAWRGDGVETTAADILEKYRLLRGNLPITQQVYDWAAKDFSIISTRSGEPFVKAEKSHLLGEDVLNTLFKNKMLYLHDTPEIRKLGAEFMGLMRHHKKQKASDDLIDATRYCSMAIPWDWTCLVGELTEAQVQAQKNVPLTEQQLKEREIEERRGIYRREEEANGWQELHDEFQFWNDAYGND